MKIESQFTQQQIPDIALRVLNYLESSGKIGRKELETAQDIQLRTTKPISMILTELQLLDEKTLLEALEHASGYPAFNPLTYFEGDRFPDLFLKKIPLDLCLKYRFFPLQILENKLFAVMEDPGNFTSKSSLQRELDLVVEPYIYTLQGILDSLKKYYPEAKDIDLIKRLGFNDDTKFEESKDEVGLLFMPVSEILRTPILDILRKPLLNQRNKKNAKKQLPSYMTDPGTVIELAERVLEFSLALQSTDIHIEPFSDSTRVRFRKDSVLFAHHFLARELHKPLVNRFKIISNLDVAEQRRPQESTFLYQSDYGHQVYMRISIVPTVHGEVVQIRILDGRQGTADLHVLGMEAQDLDLYLNNIRHPHGLILITGPTGSGKTTTLYSTLKLLNTQEKRIITAEDPIEYHLYGVTQVQINHAVGLTYPAALRAFMRQNPDVIFLGEIREADSINTAIDASLTGHLVFSTLHTNDACSAISRMTYTYKCDPQLLSESLLMVVSQRLVRRLCTGCTEEYEVQEDDVKDLGLKLRDLPTSRFFRGKGCERCGNTGYRGLTGVFEILDVNAEIRQMILSKATPDQIYKVANKSGMQSLQQNALQKCISGMTSLAEFKRRVFHKATFENLAEHLAQGGTFVLPPRGPLEPPSPPLPGDLATPPPLHEEPSPSV